MVLKPVVVSRNENEKVLTESSINSVRISICIKQADDIEKNLVRKFAKTMQHRAEEFEVLRRIPVEVMNKTHSIHFGEQVKFVNTNVFSIIHRVMTL